MSRIAAAVLVVCLLGGTAAAFAVTEGLKLEKSPILSTSVTKVFSPVCACPTRRAVIRFRLRKTDTLRVQIVGDDRVVRTLVDGARRHGVVTLTWNGRDDQGRVVRDGVYRARVHLDARHRTVELPNDVRVDTKGTTISISSVKPKIFSPDGDGRAEATVVGYRTSEPAHALLYVDGKLRVRTRRQLERSSVAWYGKVDGRALPAGVYRITLAAEDRAGNVGPRTRPVSVRIRYLELARTTIPVKSGTRFGVRVSTDAGRFGWRLGKRSGTARPGLLVLRAPGKAGRVRLVVEANGHTARALVVVRPR